METLRLNLSLALELCELIPESAFSDDSPFFRMRYAYVAAALDENLSPLLLSFIPGAQPQRTPVLDVYLLNPYGEHRETALDYLTYVAQSQSGWLYTSLYQADETVEQADYRLRLERLEKQAAELTQMLTTAAPEDIRAIQDQLDAVELQRQVLEEKRWEVNEAALKRYHQVLDTMTLATTIYYTGYHPYSLKKLLSPKTDIEKKQQNLFFFWYKPEVRELIRISLKRILKLLRNLEQIMKQCQMLRRKNAILRA